MKQKRIYIVFICLLLCGCNNPTTRVNENNSIDCNKKDELLEKGAYLIDVRTEEEYEEYHLDNAINIPVDEIMIWFTSFISVAGGYSYFMQVKKFIFESM